MNTEEDNIEQAIENAIDKIDLKEMMESPEMKKVISDAEEITDSYQKKLLASFREILKEENEILMEKLKNYFQNK